MTPVSRGPGTTGGAVKPYKASLSSVVGDVVVPMTFSHFVIPVALLGGRNRDNGHLYGVGRTGDFTVTTGISIHRSA